MDPSSSSNLDTQSRQKRVLPSRARRGGPGVGTCDTDVMILDTQRRKLESEPLIPVNTPFLLTTNPALAAGSSDNAELGINTVATELYFDQPSVLKAYREQATIQTPEYESVGDNPNVTSRMRLRGVEEDDVDTSDAAYEKRHRKYETFEKRLRLREKEKLKHEQYKLKERIEQLRAMDGSAFLSLPASSFSAPTGQPVTDDEDGVNINGSAAYNEGERRRKEMLDVAQMLEERYRILLPPDRAKKLTAPRNESASLEPEVPSQPSKGRKAKESEVSLDPEEQVFIESVQKETERLKIKLKVPQRSNSASSPHAPSPAVKSSANRKPKAIIPPTTRQGAAPRKIRASNASRPSFPSNPASGKFGVFSAVPDRESEIHVDIESEEETGAGPQTKGSPQADAFTKAMNHNEQLSRAAGPEGARAPRKGGSPRVRKSSFPPDHGQALEPQTPASHPEIAVLDSRDTTAVLEDGMADEHHEAALIEEVQSAPVGRPAKRIKRSAAPSDMQDQARNPSIPPIESISATGPHRARVRTASTHPSQKHVSYAGAAGQVERTNSLLMVAAIRSSSGGSRKAQRHVTAFGVKVPQEISDVMNFELPSWITSPKENGRKAKETQGSKKPQRRAATAQETAEPQETLAIANDSAGPGSDSMDVSLDGPEVDPDATESEKGPNSPGAEEVPGSEDEGAKEDEAAYADRQSNEDASVKGTSPLRESSPADENAHDDEEDAPVRESSPAPVDENALANDDESANEDVP